MQKWSTTSVINETVLTVRDFLTASREKGHITVHDFLVLRDQKSHIGAEEVLGFLGGGWSYKTVQSFLSRKEHDREGKVSASQVKAFLGDNWALVTIENALATIRDETVDKEATEVFTTPTHAQTFRRELKKPLYKDLIPYHDTAAIPLGDSGAVA